MLFGAPHGLRAGISNTRSCGQPASATNSSRVQRWRGTDSCFSALVQELQCQSLGIVRRERKGGKVVQRAEMQEREFKVCGSCLSPQNRNALFGRFAALASTPTCFASFDSIVRGGLQWL